MGNFLFMKMDKLYFGNTISSKKVI